MLFKKKVQNKANQAKKYEQDSQDLWSAQEFYKGLKMGKDSIGSLLFSGDEREEKITKQICSYLGYKYKGKEALLCKYQGITNTFYVTHYKVS